ncbi:uncharacterized protein [Haliotis cracherodii]|uniref:uncharacterized protein n=1 Tax=Haliotis cracherodii TaxID=6455 RepID=UPI0039E7C8BC
MYAPDEGLLLVRRSCPHAAMVPVLFLFCLRMPFIKADLFCEEVVDLGAPANLTCNIMSVSNAHSYSTPHGHSAASCDLSDGKCIRIGDFSAYVINTTCSVLSIPSVLQSHGGKWTCIVDANQANHDTCHMTVAKVPSCNITSDQNTSGLSGDDVLVLEVVVTGYYCSQVTHLQLLTGRTTTNLMNTTVTNMTDGVFVTSVSVTELTLADVKLRFNCCTRTWDVSCDGAEH